MDGKMKRSPLLLGVALTLVLLIAAGCATRNYRKDYSSLIISQSEKAIEEARVVNASAKAPAELKAAEEKLAQAKDAAAKEEHDRAALLGEEAKAAAEYAYSKATAEKSKDTEKEIRKNIEVMRMEVEARPK